MDDRSKQRLDRSRALRQSGNTPEVVLWRHLRAHRLRGLAFKRQQPIGKYFVDFVCYGRHLVVEVDGAGHDARFEYDTRRDAFLARRGFKVLRVAAADVINHLESVLIRIVVAAGQPIEAPDTPVISPRSGETGVRPQASQPEGPVRGAIECQ
jgi:very-short-patch-repair endonuclease